MSTSRNKTGSSAMRIVWIPGKKKQHKGVYNPTKKSNLSPNHQQKKIEPWSLGGSKGQEELLKTDNITDMASPSIVNCLPSTLGISTVCNTDDIKPEEGAVGGISAEQNGHTAEYSHLNGDMHIKTDPESTSPLQSATPQPMSPRLGPLANIDEDEHENDIDDPRDDYCGTTSNTATLLLKDRRMNKRLLPSTDNHGIDDDVDEDTKKEKEPEKCKLDRPDGVPHMRGLNRKHTIERNYREQDKEAAKNGANDLDKNKKKKKDKVKTGMNEKVVDCLYVGLACCECTIQ